ncbi:MAG: hypothetical protein OEZ33_11980 [Gammaproteobacteria bacterium]|nr:hypothetical protein [Gammaproteobacteria bacterium]
MQNSGSIRVRVIRFTALFAIVFTLFSTNASASDMFQGKWHLLLNGKAFHISKHPTGGAFNENNWGSGFQYEFDRAAGNDWVSFVNGSIFEDSFHNPSYYYGGGKGRRYLPGNGWQIDVGVVGFIMARKDYNNYRPFIGALPFATIGTKNVGVNITYVPKVNKQLAELVFVQLKIRIQ